MVHYIGNLDLFEDYPCAPDDEDYDVEDLFASYKRYSLPHIDDIIFRMSHDADFYAILDPQLAISLEDSGGCDFVVESNAKSSAYDYPREAAEIIDDDWYPPHPKLDAVLARVASVQSEASQICAYGGEGYRHLTTPVVPFDATAIQMINIYPLADEDRESDRRLQQTEDDDPWVGQNIDIRLSLLVQSGPPREAPVKKGEQEPIYPTIPGTPKPSS